MSMRNIVHYITFVLVITTANSLVWKCDKEVCKQASSDKSHPINWNADEIKSTDYFPSEEVCKLVCGASKNVQPKPNGPSVFGDTLIKINASNVVTEVAASKSVSEEVNKMKDSFVQNLKKKGFKSCSHKTQLKLRLAVGSKDDASEDFIPGLSNEYLFQIHSVSYHIAMKIHKNDDNGISADIAATSPDGAKRALEILSHLIQPYAHADKSVCLVIPTKVAILDSS